METNFIRCLFLLHCSLILFALQSCSLFQQSNKKTGEEKSSNQQIETIRQQKENTKHKEVREITIQSDSSCNDYSLLIWPKGKFSLSKEKGFEGEADKIVWSGKSNVLKTTLKDVRTREQKKKEKVINLRKTDQQQSFNKQTEKKTSTSWLRILGFCLLIIGTGSIIYRKRWR